MQALNAQGLALAYHDKSDGGLLATLAEMMIASRSGLTVTLDAAADAFGVLFNEELGAVVRSAAPIWQRLAMHLLVCQCTRSPPCATMANW